MTSRRPYPATDPDARGPWFSAAKLVVILAVAGLVVGVVTAALVAELVAAAAR
jgi:hypothetical protein